MELLSDRILHVGQKLSLNELREVSNTIYIYINTSIYIVYVHAQSIWYT